VDEHQVAEYITGTYPGVETEENFGYTFFFYGADHRLPFATLIASDNEYDKVSNLDRPGAYRLNLGVSRETFQSLFGSATVDVSGYDYTALDVVMPHPEYAKQNFICVLSPSDATWKRVQTMLREAYDIAVQREERKQQAN